MLEQTLRTDSTVALYGLLLFLPISTLKAACPASRSLSGPSQHSAIFIQTHMLNPPIDPNSLQFRCLSVYLHHLDPDVGSRGNSSLVHLHPLVPRRAPALNNCHNLLCQPLRQAQPSLLLVCRLDDPSDRLAASLSQSQRARHRLTETTRSLDALERQEWADGVDCCLQVRNRVRRK
jgi:hypothetical protein